MASVMKSDGRLSVKAYRGDWKTLLAFNLPKSRSKNLAGFTLQYEANGHKYYIHNQLQFRTPANHAQDPKEPPNSSVNAPIHKFRWIHVPGSVHQGLKPFSGSYEYIVTPRYFDKNGSMLPVDRSSSVSVAIDVGPFVKGTLALGFTRGFTQSQAFVHHFGRNALIRPKGKELMFDTSVQSGANATGDTFTFAEEYEWLGFTARASIFALLDEVLNDPSLELDVFAYDLNEPDLMERLLTLAEQGRVRIILDNAGLHHNAKAPKPEDQFERLFTKASKGNSEIKRGRFGSFAHDKVLIVRANGAATKVLTGSTNFSVTGFYVNSNHVLVFDDAAVAGTYAGVFQQAWDDDVKQAKFQKSHWSTRVFSFGAQSTSITFAPHEPGTVAKILGGIAKRIGQEGGKRKGNVLFAVMALDISTSPVLTALTNVHADESIFSFGISDSTEGIRLYRPGRKTGVLVTGKPAGTILPPPFDQVPGVGISHQVHHKFVICGFNREDAVVYCGSSNLNDGGEEKNGDNLLEIHDSDVATVFAIEALGLVDHFNFLDRYAGHAKSSKMPPASPKAAASAVGWFLGTSDKWVAPYYDENDLHCSDRKLFA
ncbi:MAG: hypothetical protein V7647_2596 [Acidobacteriota bacterium]|jgi:hypothetical protein